MAGRQIESCGALGCRGEVGLGEGEGEGDEESDFNRPEYKRGL